MLKSPMKIDPPKKKPIAISTTPATMSFIAFPNLDVYPSAAASTSARRRFRSHAESPMMLDYATADGKRFGLCAASQRNARRLLGDFLG